MISVHGAEMLWTMLILKPMVEVNMEKPRRPFSRHAQNKQMSKSNSSF
jgi:hypothetical protein